jgi:hypothetical protein
LGIVSRPQPVPEDGESLAEPASEHVKPDAGRNEFGKPAQDRAVLFARAKAHGTPKA